MAAGDHFNPNQAEHGLQNPDGAHNGDLPNIEIDAEGNGTYAAATNMLTLGDGPQSLLGADGSALLIHALPDDQISDPSGRSGARIVCGVILGEGVPGAEPPTPPAPTENVTFQPAQRAATPERIAQLQAAEGFSITVFARDVANARMMAQDADGIIYVTRPAQGDVIALMDEDGDGAADSPPMTATTELTGVHGIVITGNQVYLAIPTTIYRGEILGDGTFGELEIIVDDLPDAGQHGNRTMAFGPDGLLYVAIGSSCNDCPDPNPERATILQLQSDGSTRTIFAEGLRNTVGWGWHPETQEMWGMDHGSDGHGNDLPNEELNLLEAGNNYGWPFCFNNAEVNSYIPNRPQGMTKAEFCRQSTIPRLTYQAHSAPIGMVFYTGDQFPEEYQNDAFVAMRGSWNRMPATGYKIVRIIYDENGQPVEFEDFVTGFLIEDGTAHFGRVAGLLVLQDGSLLISEDTNGMIYRVSYTEPTE
jgi:glucose/arabinose dehydrogenase